MPTSPEQRKILTGLPQQTTIGGNTALYFVSLVGSKSVPANVSLDTLAAYMGTAVLPFAAFAFGSVTITADAETGQAVNIGGTMPTTGYEVFPIPVAEGGAMPTSITNTSTTQFTFTATAGVGGSLKFIVIHPVI